MPSSARSEGCTLAEKATSVSVILACRNEGKHIRQALDSMLAQESAGLDLEFLVADGRSTDETRSVIEEYERRYPGRIRFVDNPGKIVSTGLNRAIEAARGEYVVRMDAHTQYAPDYVIRCIEESKRTGAANVGGPARTRATGYMAVAIAAAYNSPFSCGGARFHDENFEGWVDTVTYGCWKRATLISLGMFDENLVRNQDDDLNLRTVRSGGKIWQSPKIVSWYSPRVKLDALFRQYFQYGFWKVAVIRKNRIPASPRHLVPGLFVLSMILLPLLAGAMYLVGQRAVAGILTTLWMTGLGSYALFLLAGAIHTAAAKGWGLLPVLPVALATFHVSYGLGFLLGILRGASPGQSRGESVFSTLSR